MLLGYNTNGFAHHNLIEAIQVLAEIGYQSVAITLDHHALNPYSDSYLDDLTAVSRCLRHHKMRSVVETGARYLLDPRTKHEPTLLSPDGEARQRRGDFLRLAIDVASALQSDCVSLWSGVLRDSASNEAAMERLEAGLVPLVEYAKSQGVTIGFEPEPGMLIDTMASFEQLHNRINSDHFQLTLDIGHLHCLGETPIEDHIRQWRHQIVNVHIEDMRAGVHDHLMFGEGEIDFVPVLNAFREIGYAGGLHVELSRHSHDAPAAARRAFDFLNSTISGLDSAD
ncbi:MAG: sugar phosphate isomerase/epimerase [Planctomycetaceae bacterium]|nr:sugar phosphate isomerase/epimerase [Planctomycetaceae bacterium]